ncbi:Txe/YoeB family addiction module toxin [Nocardia cyriacigeorgica]|uniref:Txe/YoeB family addiction module toxin n=1 Tax=Nocardia cyriacigeorgica TaxID=135487 RepID=UPI001893BBEE|nr:Txe/YoeB family addiction module toxin [Nocardia cyriacigeorgica]MBF6435665.1 Txe/YoeB family addiction module toxin [Nocardia cyriacigeorgica]MBF6454255.1 Txe/YoeB family addiction module toxin [Nocardia cyriacigeorgica]MBF6477896.1 Txe/YoeB family addiction module toxin [Nocardia cyriacigeorgica]MBF6552149.1 Txe/YoeB family addiction module toxin [Nocardia cyriacigeorgica]
MKVTFAKVGFEDLGHWINTDRKIALRIVRLINDIERDPFTGLGKPEPLKGDKSGYWSRRINDEHRLVYAVSGDNILIAQARYHY